MRPLYTGNTLVSELLLTLAHEGFWCDSNTKILDYGCGSGALVYALRDFGFDAYGFDIHERVNYRNPSDHAFFAFAANPQTDTSNAIVDADCARAGFQSQQFDLVISTSVIEHVQDLPSMLGDVARLLKPSGCSVHIFPRRTMLIEPHIYVPLGGVVQHWLWFYVWALAGIRNEYQEHMGARDAADNNMRYCRTGLKYLSRRDLVRVGRQSFSGVRYLHRASLHYWTPTLPVRAWRMLRQRLAALRANDPLRSLSRLQQTSALVLFSPK